MDAAYTSSLPHIMNRIQTLAAIVRSHRAEFETLRHLPKPFTDAMIEADLFRLWTPRVYGGAELPPREFVDVIEAAAALDGSFGWVLANANTMGRLVGYLAPDTARAWVSKPDCQFAGSTAAVGTARRTEQGYIVTGHWPYTSGLHTAKHLVGLCKVEEEGNAANPKLIFAHFAVEDVQQIETWTVSGLKGTGSNDFRVDDLLVPIENTHGFTDAVPLHDGDLYRFPIASMLPLSVAIVPLGIAKSAIQNFIELSSRTTAGTASPLKDRELIQTNLAKAEAMRRSGKALILSALQDLEENLMIGGSALTEARAFFRLALAHSAQTCLEAVQIIATCAGTASIFDDNALERCLRDIQAAVKHVATAPHNYTVAGQLMLGHDLTGKRF